jgi:LuxR family maltose regulon positive regulatory protein
MLGAILQTKLYIPPVRLALVARNHLITQLNQGLEQNRKLTLVSAPAGFGKTTLVAAWIQQLDRPVAWLSLDENDNELARFFTYFIAALQGIQTGIGAEIQAALIAAQAPPIENLLTMLVNELAIIKKDFILVLDDYHLIKTQPIHEALAFLLDHLPPQMHLIIATRDDPFLPLSRLRARDQMTEIRLRHLRFSSQEITTFLNQVMELGLSRDEIAALENRTEGWIAGLHLAALSMQEQEDATAFVSAFAGDDRYVVDYLVDEVLAQRPLGTREFLLQTSVLDRMTGPLCDALTGQQEGQDVLRQLERANLFVVPLDQRRRWYRYHRLFADVLRQRLAESLTPQALKTLHQRASRWYEENEYPIEAVNHALAADDYENGIRLILLAAQEMFERSQMTTLTNWWPQLPLEPLLSQPGLCLVYAWAFLATGRPKEAESCLQTAEQGLGVEMDQLFAEGGGGASLAPQIQSGLAETAVVRAQLAIGQGDIPLALELTVKVLPYLEDDDQPVLNNPSIHLRNVVYFAMGMAQRVIGEVKEATPALANAADLARELKNVHLISVAYGHLAGVQAIQGQLNQAKLSCQHGLRLVEELAGERSPMSSLCHAELGNLLYEQNDLEGASQQLHEAVTMAKPWGFWEGFLTGCSGLARLRAAQGDWSGASAVLDELADLGHNLPHMMGAVSSFRARMWLAQGDIESAGNWAHHAALDADAPINLTREQEYIILARLFIAQSAFEKAAGLIARLLEMTETGGRWGRWIELMILKAVALHANGRVDEALAALSKALKRAEPESYVRIFVDEGEPMATLLRRKAPESVAPEYVSQLLDAFDMPGDESVSPDAKATVDTLSSPSLLEPMSDRELDVLRWLKTELPGPEIARELMIALSTLRTHTQNIYGKLGVNNRRAAVRRAEDLRLL